jgi:antitoxin HicB
MHYIAKIQPDPPGLIVTFPSVPEAITGGNDKSEAMANAVDALEIALLTYAKDGKPLPSPTTAAPGEAEWAVSPSASVAAKLAFISAFQESGMSRVALARELGKAENEIRRMLDPYHATKLPAIEDALRALGKRLVISVEAA